MCGVTKGGCMVLVMSSGWRVCSVSDEQGLVGVMLVISSGWWVYGVSDEQGLAGV